MITKLELENFTLFKNKTTINFSPKINIIIGENGTGKTQLIKCCYAVTKISNDYNITDDGNVHNTLLEVFKPKDNKLGNLVSKSTKGIVNGKITASFSNSCRTAITFTSRSTHQHTLGSNKSSDIMNDPLFIPTKEVLSFVSGFYDKESDTTTLKKLFDKTYFDLIRLLKNDIKEDIESKLETDPRFGSIYYKLNSIINGIFNIEEDGSLNFYSGNYEEIIKKSDKKAITDKVVYKFKKSNERSISSNMIAEGIKKLAVLQRLFGNGSITLDGKNTLLWDEPESNMNPQLMKLIVEVLLELSRNGFQVIISTHDYVVLKWFDLLSDKRKGDHIKYHSFSMNNENVEINSTDEFLEIKPDPIGQTFLELYDADIDRAME